MNAETAVRDRIREFIQENFLFGDSTFKADDDSLLEEGVVDSTGVLELVLFVEDSFEFKVPVKEIVPDNFDSVTKIEQYVLRNSGPATGE